MTHTPSPASLPLASIVASAPDAILVVAEDGRIVLANDTAHEMFGAPSNSLLGSTVEDLIPSPARAQHARLRAGYEHEREGRRPMGRGRIVTGLRRDGTTFPAEVGLSSACDGLITCIIRDLTEHTRTAHTIHVQNAALQAAANAILITDRQGRITWSNTAFTEMTGYESDEVVGRQPRFLKSGAHDAAFFRELWTTILAGQVWRGQISNRRKDGSVYVEEQTITPVRGADGEVTHFIAIKEDVTERLRVEAELVESKEAAENAARTKAEFLANTSHELRTPLNAIIGFSELILDTELSTRQRAMLDTVRASGEALLSLINDLLDLSKLEAGRLELDLQPLELEPFCASAMAQVAPRALAKKLELFWTLSPDLPAWIVADELRLSQVLLNLTGNAVKFTERGEVSVTVGLAPGAGDASTPRVGERVRLRIEVRDTGIGIPLGGIPRLFQSFTQLDASSPRRVGGTGLGLAVSKALVERMGGAIRVTSDGIADRGSVFTFEVDVLVAPPSAPAVEHEAHFEGRRAAVLTRHAGLAGSIGSTLRAFGLDVRTVSDPAVVGGVDLVVVDEPLAHLVAHRPRVVLASLSSRALEHDGQQQGTATIAKPVRPRALRAALLELLGHAELPSSDPSCARRDGAPAALSGLRVLVAEDNVVNQRVIGAQMARLGVSITVVGDGEAALRAISSGRYDLALVDLQMPGLDGLEVARAVRALPGPAARTTLVALTASAMAGDRERSLAAGMDGHLSKPVRLGALESTLRRAVEAKGRDDEPEDGLDLDVSILDALRADLGGDRALDELVSVFVARAGRLLELARAAAEARDAAGLRRAMHELAGSAATCGASALATLAARLDRRAEGGEVDEEGLRAAEVAFARYVEGVSKLRLAPEASAEQVGL